MIFSRWNRIEFLEFNVRQDNMAERKEQNQKQYSSSIQARRNRQQALGLVPFAPPPFHLILKIIVTKI